MISMCEISVGLSLIVCFCFAYIFMWWLHNLKSILHFFKRRQKFHCSNFSLLCIMKTHVTVFALQNFSIKMHLLAG